MFRAKVILVGETTLSEMIMAVKAFAKSEGKTCRFHVRESVTIRCSDRSIIFRSNLSSLSQRELCLSNFLSGFPTPLNIYVIVGLGWHPTL